MKQREAVVNVLEKHRWVAKLSTLRDELIWSPDFVSNAKEPFANIRRIVQKTPDIYIIQPGLYWLTKMKKQLEDQWLIQITSKNKDSSIVKETTHSHYQWILAEIWNLKRYLTYIPHQDQNKPYTSNKWLQLKNVVSYPTLTWALASIQRVNTIDVMWINDDKNKLPTYVFEVEHSTDIINSLNKFVELKDLKTQCYIVADRSRFSEFNKRIEETAYIEINPKFLSYQNLDNYYDKITEYYSLKKLTWF